jgi:hypothetical protein
MDSMIERLATALRVYAYDVVRADLDPYDSDPDYVEVARTMLNVLREPTQEMIEAGNEAIWRAMIDAAIIRTA